MSTAYHPQTEGQTERANRTAVQMLRCFVNDRQDNWDEFLYAAEFAYNDSPQESTSHAPFFLTSGQHRQTPLDTLTNTPTAVPTTDAFITNITDAVNSAKTNIAAAQHRRRQHADRRRRELSFRVGDRVLLSTAHTPLAKGPAYKLKARFAGPDCHRQSPCLPPPPSPDLAHP